MRKKIYVYVFDTLGDWEIAYVTPELNSGNLFKKGVQPFDIITISNSKEPVLTMGGLKVLPDLTLDEFDPTQAAALILPGGSTWQSPIHKPILKLVKECLDQDILVGAICGATVALAQAGILNDRMHTSNDLDYLKQTCPNYAGEPYYQHQPAVLDRNLVTSMIKI